MKLKKVGAVEANYSFWQVLVVCSGKDFLEHGNDLIASFEINSPDVRLIIYITDGHVAARELLASLASNLIALSVYELELEKSVDSHHRALSYQIVRDILLQTRLPTLMLEAASFIRRDVTLLPAELQKADCALKLRFNRKKVYQRVLTNALWLQPNARVDRFLAQAISEMAQTTSENGERQAVYQALRACRGFLKLAVLPERYADRSHKDEGFIWSRLPKGKVETKNATEFRERTRARFELTPQVIVLHPKQDLGTKSHLENNTFKRRVQRLARPGRIAWRQMAHLLVELSWERGRPARFVPLPQWKITAETLKDYEAADKILIPHQISHQLPHPKAHYYMQELIPTLFTVDPNGWGGASTMYNSRTFESTEVDHRLDGFIRTIKTERITKAPQARYRLNQLPNFDILAPLQVPGDDALVYHSDVSLEMFIEALANFAESSRVKVMFRQHPFDETDLFERMRRKFGSKFVIFSRAGHIHDCLSKAKAVAVINSGVGFEAMLFDKPVMVFGRAIYDLAVFKTDLVSVDKVYFAAISEDSEERQKRYSKFISNYIYAVGFKIDEAVLNKADDRSGPPIYGPNPIYDWSRMEGQIQTGGVKLTKAPAGALRLRLTSEAAVRLQRLRKLSGMTFNRFMKRVVAPAWGRAMKPLTSPLPEDIFSGKTVALVGNASSFASGKYGSEIDSHDIVIRMNLGYPLIVRKEMRIGDLPTECIEGYFVDKKSSGREKLPVLRDNLPDWILHQYTSIQALGMKTDIWSCSTSDRSRQLYFAPLFDCTTVACHPSYEHLSLRLLLTRKVKRFPDGVYKRIVKEYNIEPSSGLLWIDYLRGTGLVKLDLYGFDFFASGHIARTTPNLLEVRGKWPHTPDIERDYVMKLLKADRRVQLVDRI